MIDLDNYQTTEWNPPTNYDNPAFAEIDGKIYIANPDINLGIIYNNSITIKLYGIPEYNGDYYNGWNEDLFGELITNFRNEVEYNINNDLEIPQLPFWATTLPDTTCRIREDYNEWSKSFIIPSYLNSSFEGLIFELPQNKYEKTIEIQFYNTLSKLCKCTFTMKKGEGYIESMEVTLI